MSHVETSPRPRARRWPLGLSWWCSGCGAWPWAWAWAVGPGLPAKLPPPLATPALSSWVSVDGRCASPVLSPVAWPTDATAFLQSHQWDPATALWTLKPGVAPPAGVLSREAVLASRETYLSNHRWQDGRGWLPMRHAPRNLASLSPTQRRHDLQHFAQTHRWDEASGRWQSRGVAPQAANREP